jgi:putative thymidine phosphorylase
MKLKVKEMYIETGGALIAVLNERDASLLDLHTLDRVKIKKGRKTETVVVDITKSWKAVPKGSIGLFEEARKSLNIGKGDTVGIIPAKKPLSIDYIKKKLNGFTLNDQEINQIVWDIVHNKLSDIEITYFVSACYSNKMSVGETAILTKAMATNGEVLKLHKRIVVDKHCVGGVAGNRTTPIIVSIIAAAGFTIPKTSSRSITSPAGTADTMEVLTNVVIPLKQMKKVVEQTNGCFIWGGALNLAPSDDKIIKVERPLSIDAKSQLLASVMAKKASVSATHLLIDIPTGKDSKITSLKKAKILKEDFKVLARKLHMKIKVVITDGSQPIGNGIGPALEAKDVLYVLLNRKNAPKDLRDKSLRLSGFMLDLAGKSNGYKLAKEILESGKAYQKFVEIISAQGAKKLKPASIKTAHHLYHVRASKAGKINSISNKKISKIARIAGAPECKGAGIYLHNHVGNIVKKGENLFTIYAHNKIKLQFAKEALFKLNPIVIH